MSVSELKLENLHDSVHLGKIDDILYFLDNNPNEINRVRKSNGKTLLITASSAGQKDIVKLLLERGADVNIRDKEGCDALIWAASNNPCEEICALLLDNGADPNSTNKIESALSIAIGLEDLKIAILLIVRGANLYLNINGFIALDKYNGLYASSDDEYNAFRRIVQSTYNWTKRYPIMNIVTGCGYRPLHGRHFSLDLLHNLPQNSYEYKFIQESWREIVSMINPREFSIRVILSCDGLLRRIISYI